MNNSNKFTIWRQKEKGYLLLEIIASLLLITSMISALIQYQYQLTLHQKRAIKRLDALLIACSTLDELCINKELREIGSREENGIRCTWKIRPRIEASDILEIELQAIWNYNRIHSDQLRLITAILK